MHGRVVPAIPPEDRLPGAVHLSARGTDEEGDGRDSEGRECEKFNR